MEMKNRSRYLFNKGGKKMKDFVKVETASEELFEVVDDEERLDFGDGSICCCNQ